MRLSVRLITFAIGSAVTVAAQAPSDVESVLARVGERIADYYKRAQKVICTEKYTVQPIGWNFGPEGFARVTESELRVEADEADGDGPGEAKVLRNVKKVNGRVPRDKDKKDRAGCTDLNPLSPEPLAFLLPAHRSEYEFVAAGPGKGRDRNALLIDFTLAAPSRRVELIEDRSGHEDCFDWSGRLPTKGRIWIDAGSYDVLRVDQRITGPVDVRVPVALQRRHNLIDPVVVEREDFSIRYKSFVFREPDEVMLLPESINMLIVVRGGLQSTRRSQTFSDYRRFVTEGRLVR
jgi:hypothetical protein